MHRHEDNAEIIFTVEGKAKSLCNVNEELFFAGDCHYSPKGSEHCLINVGEGELLFYAVVFKK